MKNTKKYLSTGVALAIALFVSVQVVAMKRPVNPDLSDTQKEWIETRMEEAKLFLDPWSGTSNAKKHAEKDVLAYLEKVYYGNKPSSEIDMLDIKGMVHLLETPEESKLARQRGGSIL